MNQTPMFDHPSKVEQPHVDWLNTRLLVRGYEHDGILVDLYGFFDEDGVEVTDVTLTGSEVSLGQWFGRDKFAALSSWVERQIPAAAEDELPAYEPLALVDDDAAMAGAGRYADGPWRYA
jgi:hypothetical protein